MASFSEYEKLRFRRYEINNQFLIKLYSFLNIFNYFRSDHRGRYNVMPTRDNIFEKSATQLAHEIRTKKISSYDLVLKYIARQKEVNPVVNGIVASRYEEALREAREVDKFLATTSLSEKELEAQKPLLGVPITIKESLSLKDMPLAVGCKLRQGYLADKHGGSVRKVIEAGGIPLCVTTTPELCISNETNNLVTGKTNNPYNIRHTSGGSSGGEAALISSAASVCGLGSDVMGSVRIPAAFCGIFGHKLSLGMTDLTGHVPWVHDPLFEKCLSIGPLCRYSEDLHLLTKILSDNNPALRLKQKVDLSSLKIHFMDHNGNKCNLNVHPLIKQRLAESVKHFQTKWNCTISDIKFEDTRYDPVIMATFLNSKCEYLPDNINLGYQLTKTLFGKADYSIGMVLYLFGANHKKLLMGTCDIDAIAKFVTHFEQKVENILGDSGILLYPTFPTPAFRHGESVFTVSSCSYPGLANVLGLPATNVPVGITENGLPVGIQVIAARNQDRLCLAVAKELESVFGGWLPPFDGADRADGADGRFRPTAQV